MAEHFEASGSVPVMTTAPDAMRAALAEEEMRAALSQYLPQIERMGEQLKQTAKYIEESVVGVCDSFQGMAARAQTTVGRASSFLRDGEASAGGNPSFEHLIQTCGDTLVKIMNTTAEAGDISRRAIERIEQMDQASQKISRSLGQLDDIARGNRMLAFNARIEAAHAGKEGMGFSVVAVELAAQTTKSMLVTAEVGAITLNLRALADSTLKDLRRMNEQDGERVNQCRLEVDGSLHDLQAAHSAMAEMLNGMTDDGALLASEIAAAVRGLQFQDRAAQRIAHVVEALDTLHTRLAGQAGHMGNMAPNDRTADELYSAYTMHEERALAGIIIAEAPAGDVELF